VAGPQVGIQALRSAVNKRILAGFAERGIAIPAPRRDVRVSGPAPDSAMMPRDPENPAARVK
jgi:small-conductance mechanosensitive channel